VGNFLAVVPAKGEAAEARRVFLASLEAAREIRSQNPSQIVESDWGFAASFPRQNGTGGVLVTEPATGSWLLAVGAWFHCDGYASGTESWLLRRYFEVGASQLGRELEGFFVVLIGDARLREVVLITDAIGSCHCFRRLLREGTVLSGSSLLLASLRDCQLDSVGFQEFLNTGVVYEDRTCYQEVRKLGPASIARFSATGEAKQQYWQPVDAIRQSSSGDAAVAALWHSLTRAAKRIHGLYANPVCDLTGGYDSRALMASFLGADVRCATTVFGPADSADVVVSLGLAQMLGLPHLHSKPSGPFSFDDLRQSLPFTDGEYDLLSYAEIRKTHLELARHFDVSINGSFGEVARGYWWELLLPCIGARRRLDARRLAAHRYAAHDFDASMFHPDNRLDLVAHFTDVIERTNAGLFDFPNTFQMDHAYLMMRMQHWQGRIASSTNQIWPCLSPFMFRSVLETMLGTRPILRWRSLLIRKMLDQFSPRMARYPLEHGFPAQPTSWRNFYRFFQLATHLGEKAIARASRRLASRRTAGSESRNCSSRLELWNDERVREALCPSEMKMGVVLDSAALKTFLENSRKESFAFGDQWARLLSLECALRAAANVRKV
jgi:hypothetical protein